MSNIVDDLCDISILDKDFATESPTWSLFGTPASAPGSRQLSVFWTIDAVIATPHTLPRERTRYTVDAETA